ncbi:glycosyltransferase family 4 protein [Flavobacterium sp. PS2]|uniref:glycosyltransferase family 4 protein n=1 Tax=Flavobacterium sp. PS2 TaxID=3384157 RepID=UPI00390C576B
MKIVQIIPTLSSGGAQRITIDICNELSKKHDIFLIQIVSDSISHTTFYRNQLNNNIQYINLKGTDKKVLDLMVLLPLYKKINEIKPDVVHSHLNIVYTFLPSIFYKKAKYFHTIHSHAAKECISLKGYSLRNVIRFFYSKKLINAITISGESKKSFEEFYKLDSPILIENGCYPKVPTNKFEEVKEYIFNLKKNKDRLVFINIARCIEAKNHMLLVEVFNQLLSEDHNVLLLVIGSSFDTPFGLEIKKNARPEIIFLGPKENVADYLLNSDVFCLSSLWEGLPISLLEALSTGCYPICTPVGGIPNVIVNSQLGLLSKSVSHEDFYTVIKKHLMSKSNIDKEYIKNYFDENFHIKKTVEKLSFFYLIQ